VKPRTRPVHLDLFRIRLPLPGWVSILHRASGVLLFLALPLGVAILSVSLTSEAAYWAILATAQHPLAKLLAVLLIWAFSHHWFAGLRHLAMDAHLGLSLRRARASALATLAASALTTLAFAVWLFA